MTGRRQWRRQRRRLACFFRRRGRSTGGFLLLEALVAVGIMAFILSVLPSGVIISRKSVQTSANVVGARLVAESVLTNEFTGPVVPVGTRNGTLDGYKWATLVRPSAELEEAYPSRRWGAYDVTVQVLVPDGPTLTLETIRVGRNK
jgi:hypothetical protein